MNAQATTDTVVQALETARERVEPVLAQAVVVAREQLETTREQLETARENLAPKMADALHAAADRADRADQATGAVTPKPTRWPWVIGGALLGAVAVVIFVGMRRRAAADSAAQEGSSDAPYATDHFPSERPDDRPADAAEAKVADTVAAAKESVGHAVEEATS